MNSKYRMTWPYSFALFLIAVSCSTEPDVNWDKLEEYTYVACELVTYPTSYDSGIVTFRQSAIVHRMVPITGLIFDQPASETDTIYNKANFTIPDATVSIYDDSAYYYFYYDSDIKEYIWEGTEQFVVPGKHYELDVELSDGHTLHAETIVPNLQFEENSDTIWVWPDSVTSWYSDRRQPLSMAGKHYAHTIPLHLSPSSFISQPSSEIGLGQYDRTIVQGLWYKIERDDSTLFIQTATDSLTKILNNFRSHARTIYITITYSLEEYALIGDDSWPIVNLEETSNIEGGYGYFYGGAYRLDREFIFALLPDAP